ncbi:AAA family ATPase [Oceanisphaera psychrotolerans]|uniref:AAA family ATPase n=1 Tax=Oceanisphaera psychrotolerans TaxID=1414654 RepID=UPI0009F6F2DE|nr:AAA family ATPase [Oceanisphaera psychrotolerans]
MELSRVIIHNFRSVKDADFEINPYTLVVGENNSGKTNLLSALRTFYEDGGLKYDKVRDFPKFETDDNESWVELHFTTTDEEQGGLKESYRSTDKILNN